MLRKMFNAAPKARSTRRPFARVVARDRQQLELKLEYQPDPERLRTTYRVELFFFLPSSLNVGTETYPRQQFYADIHNYVRLKTPTMDFDEILFSHTSPLVKLETALGSDFGTWMTRNS